MFSRLTNFKYKRKGWEPLGFYLAYLFLLMLISSLVSGVVGTFNQPDTFFANIRVDTIISVIFCIALAYLISQQKKSTKGFGGIVLILLSGVLAIWWQGLLGGVIGLTIPAYLSSKK